MIERVFRKAGLLSLIVLATGAVGCSKTVREGRSPAYLIIESLEGAAITEAGEDATDFSGELSSDVVTNGSIFEDLGEVTFRLGLKDIGTPDNPSAPTTNNFITVNRYRVEFRRTDGRNTPGVDVPYPFEGAGTVTVGASPSSMVFILVRVQSKAEPPLINLANGGGAFHISTIADVTFFGRDQVGNDVTVTGSISVNFGDWADPEN